MNYGLVSVLPTTGYGVHMYGCGVGKSDPQYTHVQPYEQLDETARHQIILSQALVNEFMLHVPVTEFSVMVGSMDYTTTNVNTLMRELFDLMCLQPCYATMHLLQGGPIFMESQNMIQRASTMKYDIMDYPFFCFIKSITTFLVLVNI